MRPYEDHHDLKPRERRRSTRELGDGEQDTFLDRMSGLLDAIARECATIGRTDDAGAVLAKATSAFEGVQRLCRDAGIVHADDADDECALPPSSKGHASTSTRVVPVRAHDLKHTHVHAPSQRVPDQRTPSSRGRELNLKLDDDAQESEDGSLPPPTPLRYRLPLSSGEDIIEVEITDILTNTQEEIQRWKHEFRLQLMEQEAKQHDQNRAHMEQIQALKDALSDSQRHISKLARTIQDTNETLETMQALSSKSQKAMELTLKEHTQYWKAICHDLVVEKRTIATKLAEERGKYHALREHMGMHDSTDSKADAEPRGASVPSSYQSTKPKRSEPVTSYSTKTASSKTHHTSYGSHSASDVYTVDDVSPPRASFRRYYLSKS